MVKATGSTLTGSVEMAAPVFSVRCRAAGRGSLLVPTKWVFSCGQENFKNSFK